MRNRDQHIYVGVDLHKEFHVAVIINCWHEKLGEIKFVNMPSAFDHFIEQVNQYALEGRTPVFGGGYRGLWRSISIPFIRAQSKCQSSKSCISS